MHTRNSQPANNPKPGSVLPLTEQRNPVSATIDTLSTLEMCRLMNRQDAQIPLAVAEALPHISNAIDFIVASLRSGNRLFYMGAGTSGRLGVLDASELQPTFNWPPERAVALIAGGVSALTQSIESAEDSENQGKTDLSSCGFSDGDVLIGLAASGHTPYVMGGLRYAASLGAKSVAVVCTQDSPMTSIATVTVELLTGPEIITGSTRMKAGTAQKMVLNMLSTGAMIRLGKVYGNLMVDVRPTNQKLRARAVRIVCAAAELPETEARSILERAGWDVKVAVVMALMHEDPEEARRHLDGADGHIRDAISQVER